VTRVSQTSHSHSEAAYWIIPVDDAFSVEVITPEDHPTTVSPFATASDAKAWIDEHQRRVQSEKCRADGFAAPAARNKRPARDPQPLALC
jgi:hypothetical protein